MGIFNIFSENKLPHHIALTVENSGFFEHGETILNLKNTIKIIADLNIPLMTFSLSNDAEFLEQILKVLNRWEFIHENQIKVTVLGKWYNLPETVVNLIKETLESTKDYDKMFLNICINYDGQEEIVDACKLIAKQVQLGRIDSENIDKSVIKENIYTSYFLPPDVIIKTGNDANLKGFLLWDMAHSRIYFANKNWSEFSKTDLLKAIKWWSKE